MASIRMTRELAGDIFNNAVKMYEKANPDQTAPSDLSELICQAIRESELHRAQETFYQVVRNRVARENHRRHTDQLNSFEVTRIDIQTNKFTGVSECQVDLPTPFRVYDGYDIKKGWKDVYLTDLPPEHQHNVFVACEAEILRDKAAREAKTDYCTQIRKLVQECTTVKQLLDVWPGAESLIPPDKLQAMHVKTTRATKARQIREASSFDPTEANKTMLTAKLMGA
jgi:hypothetical protein